MSFDGRGLRLDTSEDAEVICNELVGKNVRKLILQGNTFGIEASQRIGMELANQPNLVEAHFKDLFTSRGRDEVPEAMKYLLDGISDSGAQLTLLDLSDNAIGPIGAPSVINFLESPSATTLEKLYLNNCGLGPEGSSSIAATISKLESLREFVCGRNRLENKGAANISRALSELTNLEVLKVNQNGIMVEGIKKFVEVLKANEETITEIDFSDNTIKAEGARALAKTLSRLKSLRSLRLDDALLQNEGFSVICTALASSPCLSTLEEATFEGNELHSSKTVDLIEITFSNCQPNFTLNLLENDFAASELSRLESLGEKFGIIVDDIESDEDATDEDDESGDKREDGELDDGSEVSNGYVDLGNFDSELRDVSIDFIEAVTAKPYDKENANAAFIQLISTGLRPEKENGYQAVQILCEELGLIKPEQTRKNKPLAREAIIYIGKRMHELPVPFRNFFEVVIKNNDDLGCGKILFEKLDI